MKYRFFQGAILKDANGDTSGGSSFKPESVLVGAEGESLADYVNEPSKQLYSEQQANKDLQEIHDEISELSKVVDDKLVSFSYLSNTTDDPNGVNIKNYFSYIGGESLTVTQYENRFQWNCRVIKDTDGKYYLYADYWLTKKFNITVPSTGANSGFRFYITSFNNDIATYLLNTLKAQYGTKYQNLLIQFSNNEVHSINACGATGTWSGVGKQIGMTIFNEDFNIIQAETSKAFGCIASENVNCGNVAITGTIRCLITFNE